VRAALVVFASASVALASCRSALDVQVEGAIARARVQESHRATTDQAEELARPVWWHGAPIAVPTATSRTIGAWCVHTPALAFTEGAPSRLVVSGPRGDVRLELVGGSFASQAEIAAWLSAADTSARIRMEASDGAADGADEGTGGGTGGGAGAGALLAIVTVGSPSGDGAYHLASAGTSAVAASAAAVIARCVWFDAMAATPDDASRSSYELALASDDELARATSGAVLVRPSGDGAAAREFAARAGFAIALALADGRASELDRHLVTLDGDYSARIVGEGGAVAVAPERLAWWHRDVRARLRALALGGDSASVPLEPPR
jgi:hypothetical protein